LRKPRSGGVFVFRRFPAVGRWKGIWNVPGSDERFGIGFQVGEGARERPGARIVNGQRRVRWGAQVSGDRRRPVIEDRGDVPWCA